MMRLRHVGATTMVLVCGMARVRRTAMERLP